MPHIPRQFRPPLKDPGTKAPLATDGILDGLPVTPEPARDRKPDVPVAGRPRVRKRFGLERIDIRKFEKSPDEIWEALTETGFDI